MDSHLPPGVGGRDARRLQPLSLRSTRHRSTRWAGRSARLRQHPRAGKRGNGWYSVHLHGVWRTDRRLDVQAAPLPGSQSPGDEQPDGARRRPRREGRRRCATSARPRRFLAVSNRISLLRWTGTQFDRRSDVQPLRARCVLFKRRVGHRRPAARASLQCNDGPSIHRSGDAKLGRPVLRAGRLAGDGSSDADVRGTVRVSGTVCGGHPSGCEFRSGGTADAACRPRRELVYAHQARPQ